MRTVKRWLDRSLTAQAVLIILLGVGGLALLNPEAKLVGTLITAAFYTCVAIGILAIQRRRACRVAGTDARGYADLNHKIRHREVPQSPDERDAMRRLVGLQLRDMELAGRWLPYLLWLVGIVGVLLMVLGAATGQTAEALGIAVMTALFVVLAWQRHRNLDRHRYMREALQEEREPVA
ncbi:hypothetical protein G5C51_30305 [Streptomyces sp. A7024]|uniref:Uncharacterized protein n=1 Tax=Streptomyces coryli TaxID=1128680 RepID=A0A6G4U7G9_9ACTN|nr:hypothetical protein [Streptomyces coryli]NGN68179.1 hypothetical protein [Streptomyces coryli]